MEHLGEFGGSKPDIRPIEATSPCDPDGTGTAPFPWGMIRMFAAS